MGKRQTSKTQRNRSPKISRGKPPYRSAGMTLKQFRSYMEGPKWKKELAKITEEKRQKEKEQDALWAKLEESPGGFGLAPHHFGPKT